MYICWWYKKLVTYLHKLLIFSYTFQHPCHVSPVLYYAATQLLINLKTEPRKLLVDYSHLLNTFLKIARTERDAVNEVRFPNSLTCVHCNTIWWFRCFMEELQFYTFITEYFRYKGHKQNILGRTNCLLSFHATRTAQKTMSPKCIRCHRNVFTESLPDNGRKLKS
jgi:hypothetical protein